MKDLRVTGMGLELWSSELMLGVLYYFLQLNLTHLFTSTWFYECQVFSSKGRQHLQAGQNPELRVLFYRLAALSRLPISAVFVFDGVHHPKKK